MEALWHTRKCLTYHSSPWIAAITRLLQMGEIPLERRSRDRFHPAIGNNSAGKCSCAPCATRCIVFETVRHLGRRGHPCPLDRCKQLRFDGVTGRYERLPGDGGPCEGEGPAHEGGGLTDRYAAEAELLVTLQRAWAVPSACNGVTDVSRSFCL